MNHRPHLAGQVRQDGIDVERDECAAAGLMMTICGFARFESGDERAPLGRASLSVTKEPEPFGRSARRRTGALARRSYGLKKVGDKGLEPLTFRV